MLMLDFVGDERYALERVAPKGQAQFGFLKSRPLTEGGLCAARFLLNSHKGTINTARKHGQATTSSYEWSTAFLLSAFLPFLLFVSQDTCASLLAFP